MNGAQKTVFIGLGVFLLLFVAVVGYGTTQPNCTGAAADCARKNPASAGMKSLGGLFGSGGSRIQLPQARYDLFPGRVLRISVPAGGSGLRTLKIVLRAGAALDVRYDDRAPDRLPRPPGDAAPVQQGRVPGDAASPDDPQLAAFTVSSAGGTLTLNCLGGQPCAVAQP